MAKDFSRQDLRGRSFKNNTTDLIGADFSDCDLRGVDFSRADLTAARFCRARMGRTIKYNFVVIIIKFLIGFIAGYSIPKNNIVFVDWIKSSLEYYQIFIENSLLTHLLIIYLFFLCTSIIISCNSRRFYFIICFAVISLIFGLIGGFNIFTTVVSLIGSSIITMSVATIITIGEISAIFIAIVGVLSGITAITLTTNQITQGIDAGVLFMSFGLYLIYSSFRAKESLKWIHYLGTHLNSLGSTKFAFTTLKEVTFNEADIKYANFKNSIIIRCDFQQVKNHHLALTDGTPLALRKVRDLIINGISTDKNFAGLDLNGLDFSGLNLRGYNFADANVSFANFSHCHLENANLREINAVGTCFNAAYLTGVCIQNWNIDARTQLNDIDCDYVYLVENEQQRNPPEDKFNTGEFSKLYQQITDTIDFIAHSRDELDALISAIETIKAKAGNEDIFVQNIGLKESSIVLKLKAPPEFDREEIYKEVKNEQKKKLKQLKKEYEQKLLAKQSELDQERKDTKDLLADLLKDSIQRPITVEQNLVKEDNSRHFSGNGNNNIIVGDNNSLTNAIQQLPAEQNDLKALLSQLQTLINTSSLSDDAKKRALTKTQDIAEATQQPEEEQQNIVQKTLGYFDGLADSLESGTETAIKLGETVAGIASLFGL